MASRAGGLTGRRADDARTCAAAALRAARPAASRSPAWWRRCCLIGGMKFTAVEIEALRPLISGTPWLAWLYPALGAAGASYLLGVVEIAAGLLVLAAPLSPGGRRRGRRAGGADLRRQPASLMLALPIWEPTLGFPALGPLGQFLVKDVALLGIALVVLAESLARRRRRGADPPG